MPTIKGNLELDRDTTYDESLIVEGSITGKNGNRYSLLVRGDINAGDINARNINARDIDAWDINARNINARDINALDINALNIDALDINALDIDAWNINARNIDARNIDALDINAGDINAHFILCETLKQKEGSRLFIKKLTDKRSSYEQKEIKKVD